MRAEKLEAPPAPVVASDIDAGYVAMAQKSALKARVERYMSFSTQRFQDAEPPAERGLLVTNLPYGDRIGSREGDIRLLYEEVGDTLKRKFSGWQAALLAADASPYKADRAQAEPDDPAHERQHPLQVAAVRSVRGQPSRERPGESTLAVTCGRSQFGLHSAA